MTDEPPAPEDTSPIDAISGEPNPDMVVNGQLTAYNEHDAAAFAAHFGPDATVRQLADDEVVVEGREAIRQEYAAMFEARPDLQCDVTDRLQVGEYVVCAERVEAGDETEEALAIYRIEDGLIRTLWLG